MSAPDRTPRRLFIVADDDAEMRGYVHRCLARMDAPEVLEACDGEEALRLAQDRTPDLILSDVAMPRMDGRDLCRSLRADDRTATIPLLLFSGETRTAPVCADAFLAKPFNAAVLREHVTRLLAPRQRPPPS